MFEHCLYFNTSALARRLDRLWADAFQPWGLTPPQGFLLRAVLRRPGLLSGELAEAMVLSRPTVTRAIDGLVAKGLVQRQPSAKDGRETEIHPTAAAAALETALDAASAAITARLKRQLGDPAFADLVGTLRGLRSALK